MMRSRWLSTFSLIGVLLIVLGIVGLVFGHRFVYDPGQPVNGKEPWYYLIIGALMLLNGLLTPPIAEETRPPDQKKERGTNAVGPPVAREVIVTAADKPSRD